MLTANEIGTFIAQPEAVRPEHLDDLHQLTEKYPYAQLFSMLYLRGLSANNSVDFESALKQHSYRISDRAQLYRLIHDHEGGGSRSPLTQGRDNSQTSDLSESTAPAIDEAKSVEVADEKITVQPTEVAPEEVEAEAIEDVTEELEIAEELESVQSNTPELKHPLEEKTQEVSEETVEEAPVVPEKVDADAPEDDTSEESITFEPTEDPLDTSILHHAVANNYRLEELTEDEEAALEKQSSLPDTQDDAKASDGSDSVEKESTPATHEKVAEEEKHLSIDTKQSFTGWLKSDANYAEAAPSEADSIHAVVDDFSEFDPMESLYGEIEKPKKEFFSPAKKAKESLREDQLPVSETLAKIYIMQGNYPMAIKAYEELSLSFPEKKIFFANLIEDLQKKLNK